MERKDYEIAADIYREAEKKYREMEQKFMDGSIIESILPNDYFMLGIEIFIAHLIENYKSAIEYLKYLRDERNTKLTDAKNALRSAVQLNETQWRGIDGKPTILKYGDFQVASVTRRKLDPDSLLGLAKDKGILDKLLSLKGINKEGREYNLVKQEWDIDYEAVKTWLEQNNLTDILNAAYDESETTPQVKGPKLVAFLGENKE